MNIKIKALTPELIPDYLEFFDNRAFSDTDTNGPCYCTCPTQTSEEIDQMVRAFTDDVKGMIRRHAAQMLDEGKIRGYLAYDGNTVIGWCNAGDMNEYAINRYQFVPDFARCGTAGKTMSVVCFAITPDYRGTGVSTALLEHVIAEAKTQGYAAVEGYAHTRKVQHDMDFKGPVKLYEKLGFIPVAEQDGVVVMRKIL